ncbi:MAG: hypothetical protein J6J17_03945 [Bacilli bacterium]|nr:hypothetical protein [Bacilli bacterium]
MSLRFFIFLFGFGLTIIGLSYIIIYLNLLSIGYNFFEYVNFIIRRIECLNVFFGITLMIASGFVKGGKNELYL